MSQNSTTYFSVNHRKYSYVKFDTIILRAESFEELGIPNPLEFLLSNSSYNWVYNNHMYYTYEMSTFSTEIANEWFKSLKEGGFKHHLDYVCLHEQLVFGVKGRICPTVGKRIPGTELVPWLSSKVTKSGNLFWRNKTDRRYTCHRFPSDKNVSNGH